MESIFLSNKNINSQTKKLVIYLNLDEEQLTKDTVFKCRKIILNSMILIFDKYGNKKPHNIPIIEYINKLNKKSLSECIKLIEAKKNNKKLKFKESNETLNVNSNLSSYETYDSFGFIMQKIINIFDLMKL